MSITKQKHLDFFIVKIIFFIFMIISVSFKAVKAQEQNREISPPSQSEPSSERKETTSQEKTPKKVEKSEYTKISEKNKNSSIKKTKKPDEKPNSEAKQTDKPESENKNTDAETENKPPEINNSESRKSTSKPIENKEKNEPQSKPENENETFNLPKVSDSEIDAATSKLIQKPKSKRKKSNIFLTILSWSMIISGIFIILKVIFDNLKIPRGFDPRIKIKHGSKKNNRKNRYDLNKLSN